jgi:uncharacterized protein (TIGR03067 family)
VNCFRIAAVAAIAFIAGNSAIGQDQSQPKSRSSSEVVSRLQGVWKAPALNKDGIRLASEDTEKITITIREDHLMFIGPDGSGWSGRFRIDASQQPVRFDLAQQTRFDKIEIQLGIVEADENSVRIAIAMGDGQPRPAGFTARAGVLIIVLQRPVQ